jgi:hypothetical protein
MKLHSRDHRTWLSGVALLLSACATTGVNPTGLTGGQAGPRETEPLKIY